MSARVGRKPPRPKNGLWFRPSTGNFRKAGSLTGVEIEVGYPLRISTVGASKKAFLAIDECMRNQLPLSIRALWCDCIIQATGNLIEFSCTPIEEGRNTTFCLTIGMAVKSWQAR